MELRASRRSRKTISLSAATHARSEKARELYERHAAFCYGFLRRFMPAANAIATLNSWGKSLLLHVADSAYVKYERPFVLRLLVSEILSASGFAAPKELLPLNREELLALILRDAYAITPHEIATALSTSEGGIRTRLLSSRLRCFSTQPEAFSKPSTATFFELADAIEQADSPKELDALLAKSHGDPKSNHSIEIRKASLDFFASTPDEPLPELHKTLDIEPLLVRKGLGWKINLGSSPWYLRILFEGVISTLIVVSIVFSMPRAKKVYEFWIERRLDLYSLAEFTQGSGEATTPSTSTAPTTPIQPSEQPVTAAQSSSSNAAAAPAAQTAPKTRSEFTGRAIVKPTSDKIYRMFIQTEFPDQTKQSVLSILSKMKSTPAASELYSEIPGGVMFDMFVPLTSYTPLIGQLNALGKFEVIETRPRHEKIIPGKLHIMLWLRTD